MRVLESMGRKSRVDGHAAPCGWCFFKNVLRNEHVLVVGSAPKRRDFFRRLFLRMHVSVWKYGAATGRWKISWSKMAQRSRTVTHTTNASVYCRCVVPFACTRSRQTPVCRKRGKTIFERVFEQISPSFVTKNRSERTLNGGTKTRRIINNFLFLYNKNKYMYIYTLF